MHLSRMKKKEKKIQIKMQGASNFTDIEFGLFLAPSSSGKYLNFPEIANVSPTLMVVSENQTL